MYSLGAGSLAARKRKAKKDEVKEGEEGEGDGKHIYTHFWRIQPIYKKSSSTNIKSRNIHSQYRPLFQSPRSLHSVAVVIIVISN